MRFFLLASGVASRRPKSGIEAVKGKRFPAERFACHIAWERKDVCTFRSFYAIIAAKRQKYLLPIRAVLPGPGRKRKTCRCHHAAPAALRRKHHHEHTL